MNNTQTSEFLQLLEQGKWEEALPGLREYLKSDASPAEKGRVQVLLAEAYMNVATEINNGEIAALDEVAKIMGELDEKEQKFDDDTGLAQARSVLK